MYSLPRSLIYQHNLRRLTNAFRSVCSNKSKLLQESTYNNPTKVDEAKEVGYGEKEICLLHPLDMRAPLPGNTGIPYFQLEPASKQGNSARNCKQALHMPEDRHKNTLTQLAYIAVENLLYSPVTLECQAHDCPQLLKNDFCDLFPMLNMSGDNFTVLTLCQKTEEDMSIWSQKADTERTSLQKIFVIAAQSICSMLRECGYFADFIHPTSGKPAFGEALTTATMFETDRRYVNFGFTIEDLGCCKVISHHRWGTHAFVGAIFTNASINSPELDVLFSKGLISRSV